MNRLMHLSAKLAVLGVLAVAIVWRRPELVVAAPLLAVLPCWFGHWVFEGNRPTAWSRPSASLLGTLALGVRRTPGAPPSSEGRPFYSLLADLRMSLDTIRELRGGAHAE